MIKNKKITFRNELINKMESSIDDSKSFWRMLDNLKNSAKSDNSHVKSIESIKWINMFQSLLFKKDELDIDTNITPNDDVETIMMEEINEQELKISVKN